MLLSLVPAKHYVVKDLVTHLVLLQLIPSRPGWTGRRKAEKAAVADHKCLLPTSKTAIWIIITLLGRKARKTAILVLF